jgi:hypothetical protein
MSAFNGNGASAPGHILGQVCPSSLIITGDTLGADNHQLTMP